jgi:competence/damage-inducible protein CinA-like protein
MYAEIVSIGTELLLGTITDTNASYLAQRLAPLGIDCYYVSQVGDNLDRLVGTLERAHKRSDLVITTGGLGPTQDDLTREAIAALLAETMTVVPALERDLRAFFERRGVQMPERNLKQATLIPSAQVLPNPVGTAPGWWVTTEDAGGTRILVAMPGVPFEMKRMWEHEVEPRLRSGSHSVILSRTLKTLGLGESAVEAKVQDLMTGSNPTLAPYAKPDGVHLRITAKADDPAAAERMIAGLESEVRARLGEAIYGADDESPAGVVRHLLAEAGYGYALLEVGASVIGSISPLLGAAPNNEAPGEGSGVVNCRGQEGVAFSVESLSSLQAITAAVPGVAESPDLEGAVRAIRAMTGADVVMGVGAEVTPAGADNRLVNAALELALLTPDAAEDTHLTRSRQTWRTESTEVRRLAGLAAYNLMRLRLLKTRDRES